MQLRKSERRKSKIRIAIQGSSGSGKTYSSLLLAKGLCNGDLSKTVVIDTENGSADLYSSIGEYNVVSMTPPYTPESYIEAIELCEKEKMEVVILDSISHSWEELLKFHSKLEGNSFKNWGKVNIRQQEFVNKLLNTNAHLIATMRSKQGYVLNLKNGKYVPEKVGLKAIQRDGIDYEFTILFELDYKHYAMSTKDRTGLFNELSKFKIREQAGSYILDWCNST